MYLHLLNRIDSSDYHALPVSSVSSMEAADILGLRLLSERGEVRRVPAKKRFPERYAVTAKGSHTMGTFNDSDDLPPARTYRRTSGGRCRSS